MYAFFLTHDQYLAPLDKFRTHIFVLYCRRRGLRQRKIYGSIFLAKQKKYKSDKNPVASKCYKNLSTKISANGFNKAELVKFLSHHEYGNPQFHREIVQGMPSTQPPNHTIEGWPD